MQDKNKIHHHSSNPRNRRLPRLKLSRETLRVLETGLSRVVGGCSQNFSCGGAEPGCPAK
jgi:hypothetical protein